MSCCLIAGCHRNRGVGRMLTHNKANQGKLEGTEQYDPELMSALQEIKQLKRQLKVAEEEREILKKATAYFAKNSP